jgi:hypothetical protein
MTKAEGERDQGSSGSKEWRRQKNGKQIFSLSLSLSSSVQRARTYKERFSANRECETGQVERVAVEGVEKAKGTSAVQVGKYLWTLCFFLSFSDLSSFLLNDVLSFFPCSQFCCPCNDAKE